LLSHHSGHVHAVLPAGYPCMPPSVHTQPGHKCVCVADGLPTWVCEIMVVKPRVSKASRLCVDPSPQPTTAFLARTHVARTHVCNTSANRIHTHHTAAHHGRGKCDVDSQHARQRGGGKSHQGNRAVTRTARVQCMASCDALRYGCASRFLLRCTHTCAGRRCVKPSSSSRTLRRPWTFLLKLRRWLRIHAK
jgi:hypothetical protein